MYLVAKTVAYFQPEICGFGPNHVETPVLIRSPKLSTVEPGQYLAGKYKYKLGCADDVRYNGSE